MPEVVSVFSCFRYTAACFVEKWEPEGLPDPETFLRFKLAHIQSESFRPELTTVPSPPAEGDGGGGAGAPVGSSEGLVTRGLDP